MRILLVQRHFWPDVTVTASMGRALAARLARDGHQVTVLSGMPSYHGAYEGKPPPRREAVDGCKVIRLRLPRERNRTLVGRAVEGMAFPARVGARLLVHGRRYDVIVTSSAPPVFLASAVRTAARIVRRPYVYHCQDVNPEAAVVSGLLRAGWRTRLMSRLDRRNADRAASVVVLSSDMAGTLRRRGLEGRNIVVVNNFFVSYEIPTAPVLSAGLRKPEGAFRVLFAGNLGLVQGLGVVMEAAQRLASISDIQFAFVGTGAGERALREQAGSMLGKTVVFYPHQSLAVALLMMQDADLGLISLAPGIFRVAYPSKTMAYLAAGCPVLAVVEGESELARMVEATGVGVACSPGDAAALAEAVLLQRERSRQGMVNRAQIREMGEREFGADRALGRWAALVAAVGADPARS